MPAGVVVKRNRVSLDKIHYSKNNSYRNDLIRKRSVRIIFIPDAEGKGTIDMNATNHAIPGEHDAAPGDESSASQVVALKDHGHTPTVPAPRYDLRILRSLRRIIRGVDLYSRQLAATHRITAPQLICLLAVVEHAPLTVTALSHEIHLSTSTLVGILDRLEEKHLIRRERGRNDRRVVWINPTAEGARLADHAPSPLQQALASGLNTLPDLEQATIALSLERVVDLMEVRHIETAPILETGPINPP
jgi:DNA-binding MarR family transcriptional regulator